MKKITLMLSLVLITALISCDKTKSKSDSETTKDSSKVESAGNKTVFGKLPDGTEADLYTLKNKNGIEVKITNYGGIIVSLKTPDKSGKSEDIVLGFDSLSSYLQDPPYFGAIVGRYGNRIAKGKFTLDGKTYTLAQNNLGNHLHGGLKGFDKVLWTVEEASDSTLKLSYLSKDLEEGYPGNLKVNVIYTLSEDNALKIDYEATTDKATVVNLTNHTYFNLTAGKRDILDHELQLQSTQFVPVDKTLIPTGELKSVKGTPFDFSKFTKIGARINEKDEQLKLGNGYDHCWVLDHKSGGLETLGALYEPESGRVVEFATTEPAVQFYSGNFLDGKFTGKAGVKYQFRYGACLETEHYPDSPNQPKFPTTVLKPNEVYKTSTVYKFSTK